ncbi:DUF4405 domain-containing protein [Salipiger bermudensis]|uniref:DUF4405 domain-containing protein n=1 Tax=Salipiger bermudensis (strain DSM 26914 / JCM 13377 / KCTC 12554 / HTCC2601) TaxID=314265 RepID=Q0FJ54_SALBH|nr:DUF4405 domain-containing protein [Salipiger bermudensis]EAU44204.1 hypothetical protein R2601_27213 [Salipiger bermudensis HTCC2601]MAE90768.1 DUF4405 domain-containing protein [Pelagibaca sp.]
MSQLLNRTATPLVTGLFLVSLVSGVALFFHWAPATFHAMHEWLSIVLILPFALHIWKNWRPMSAYLRRPVFAVAMVASLAAALAFVVPSASNSASGGRPPQFAVAQQVLNGSVDAVASVMGETPEALGAALSAAGFTVADSSQSLSEIAVASGQPPEAILALLAAQGS